MDLESIVEQILLIRHDLTREEVLKKIYEKKRSSEDYFLDEVAARIVALELGVEIQNEEERFSGEIAIKNLVSGLNNVTLIARVVAVNPVQTFTRNDSTEGKVARLLLADKTGKLRLALWNDRIESIETNQIKRGQIVRVLHAYVRESFDGQLELHLGNKGDLEISPQNVDESQLPRMEDFMDKIGQLKPEKKTVSVAGTIIQVFPVSEFTRKDGTSGKVRRLRLRDETGEITAVFWNEKADELGALSENDQLQIMNARTKTGLNGRIELHVENSSQIERTAGQPPQLLATTAIRRIADLEEGELATIEATVASTPVIREVTTSQGEKVLVASFELTDDSGKIGVSLWRRHAELARTLQDGTKVKLKDVFVKKGFSNLLQLSSRSTTAVEIASKPSQ